MEENILNERKKLSQFHNSFIVNIYFVFKEFMILYLIKDYLSGGNLNTN